MNIESTTSRLSSARHGCGVWRRRRYSNGGAPSAASPALTPPVYASRTARSRGVSTTARLRFGPEAVHADLAIGGKRPRPTSAASSPAARRRVRSIWKKRSCACRNPVARATSSRVRALNRRDAQRVARDRHRSRRRPARRCVPSSSGRLARSSSAGPQHRRRRPARPAATQRAGGAAGRIAVKITVGVSILV